MQIAELRIIETGKKSHEMLTLSVEVEEKILFIPFYYYDSTLINYGWENKQGKSFLYCEIVMETN